VPRGSLWDPIQSRHLGGYEANPRHRPSAAGHRVGQLRAGQQPGFCEFLYDVPQSRHRVAWGAGRSRLLGPAPAVAAESALGVVWPRCAPWGGQRLPGPLFPFPLPELQLPCRHKYHAGRLQALGRCFPENQLGEAGRRDCTLGV